MTEPPEEIPTTVTEESDPLLRDERTVIPDYVLARNIARELREAGVRTLSRRTDWRNTVILKILRNEKYCGDLKQKKTYTPDYLTHQKRDHHGEEAFVFIKNHHEPIGI